jgi:predicted esterase YcpF (UPF0227 family)
MYVSYRGEILKEKTLHSGNKAYLNAVHNDDKLVAYLVDVYTPDKHYVVSARPFEVWNYQAAVAYYNGLQV